MPEKKVSLDELPLPKDFVEFLNRQEEEEIDITKAISEFFSVPQETAEKALDEIREELSQIFHLDEAEEGKDVTMATVLYSLLKAIKARPTLMDYLRLYHAIRIFQKLNWEANIQMARSDPEALERLLHMLGKENLLRRQVEINLAFLNDGGMSIQLNIPQDTLRIVVDEIYRRAMAHNLAKAVVSLTSPLMLFKTLGGEGE